jgi:hypothetical protein
MCWKRRRFRDGKQEDTKWLVDDKWGKKNEGEY